MSEIREHTEYANKSGTNWKSLLKGFVLGTVISSILLIVVVGLTNGGIFLIAAPPVVFLIAIVAVIKKRNSFGIGILLGSLTGILCDISFFLILFLDALADIDFN